MSHVTIYHNPSCSKSRQALGLLEEKGLQPEIILYKKTPPSVEELTQLISQMGVPVREVMRRDEPEYKEADLDNPQWTDEQLIAKMVECPVLMNRPIVVTDKGVRLCRPMELLDEIL